MVSPFDFFIFLSLFFYKHLRVFIAFLPLDRNLQK